MMQDRKRKAIAVFTSLAFFLSVMILSVSLQQAQAAGKDDTYEISIVSTNDMHARAEASESGYGFGRVKAIADAQRSVSDMTMLLDAGDFYHGQSFATLTNGENIAKLAAAAGYDAVCVGNHDWNYGKDRLLELAQLTAKDNTSGGFALLGGNVKDSSGKAFFEQEYLVKEMPTTQGEAVKVGVFGVIDPVFYAKTAPANVEGLTFDVMSDYAVQAVLALKEQGCDLIIGMSHCIDPAALAESVSGVNLWIAGHEHISLQKQVTDPSGQQVYVLEAGYAGSEVDVTSLRFSWKIGASKDYEVTDLTVTPIAHKEDEIEKTASDQTIDELYQGLADAQAGILEEKIGETPVKLEASWEAVRIKETSMGRLVTHAYLAETGADIALENAGGIRTGRDVEAGDITKKDAVDTFPYGNYLVTKEITGAQLREMLEISIQIEIENNAANEAGEYDGWPANSGSYLQAGGAKVYYDLQKPQGSRIWKLEVGGSPVEDAKNYTVATNNYSAISEDYPMLAKAEEKHQYIACDEIFIKYLQQTGADALTAALQDACMVQEQESADSILPKGTEIQKLTAKRNGFQAVWKKRASVTGYQLQYSESKKFKRNMTVSGKTKNAGTVQKSVKGLKSDRTYYVRIRTYIEQPEGTVYSAWSKVKKVKAL